MRTVLVAMVLLACGTRNGPSQLDSSKGPAVDAGANVPGDGGATSGIDAGDVADSGATAQDGGREQDAGSSADDAGSLDDAGSGEDAGSTADAGGGIPPGTLTITVNPASQCASWLPQDADSPLVLDSDGGTWDGVYTDGVGDIAITWYGPLGDYGFEHFSRFLPVDGGAPVGIGGYTLPIPERAGFVWEWHEMGPCMICGAYLQSWPSGTQIFLGNGYPWDGSCSYTPRPVGGVYTSCAGWYPVDTDGGPVALQKRDDALQIVSETQGIEPTIVAVDRLDRLVVAAPNGQQWIDADGTQLSGLLGIDATGSGALIGGGLLTVDDHVIASGSADVQVAPQWLRGRAHQMSVVLGGRAYAFGDPSCKAAIYDSAGDMCGTLTFGGCMAPPWFGPDGSAVEKLPNGAWKIWPQLLQ